jgi:hypothetical protein
MASAGRIDLIFSTDRFNMSAPQEYFINDCCYGDDAACWFVERLREHGLTVAEPNQEDWGWYFDAHCDSASYFVGVGGNSDDEASSRNRGEWRLMVQKRRSLWEKLSGANRLSKHDGFIGILKEILSNEPDLQLVGIE